MSAATILVTGASSGIGRATAAALARPGVRFVLVARDPGRLSGAAREVAAAGASATVIAADLALPGAAEAVAEACLRAGAAPDLVVHAAGANDFSLFEDSDAGRDERIFRINVLAPMALTRALLPALRRRGSGRIVFVGSIFGSIAFPCFAVYSSTKFALRGFAEALRRELAGTGIGVTYVAPRGTRTPMTASFDAAADAAGMHLDDVSDVARRIADAAVRGRSERYLGFPESVFVRINALLPRLVDRALRSTRDALLPFAGSAAGAAADPGALGATVPVPTPEGALR